MILRKEDILDVRVESFILGPDAVEMKELRIRDSILAIGSVEGGKAHCGSWWACCR